MSAERDDHPAVPSDHVRASQPPGGVDCSTVLADVFLYLDDEADTDARERIRVHLDGCSPCLRQFGLERDVKALIARCCGGDRAPDTLRTSIRWQLSQTVAGGVETTVVERTTEVSFRTGF